MAAHATTAAHPYASIKKTTAQGHTYFDITRLHDKVGQLPFTIRIVLESLVRNCDGFAVTKTDVENCLDYERLAEKVEIPFKPARVLMQDFTGVPAVVDLAAMRDCVARLGGDAKKINPLVPVDLVIDHSIQVDATRVEDALQINEAKEFERNSERFTFLKWGSQSFENLNIVPPGNGIVHQVNLEYLARVVFAVKEGEHTLLYPDTLVGTDSHTTMINGLGCLGWGVGGIEAESNMLGQPSAMVLPPVVGYKLTGTLPAGATATDLVLTITQNLRKHGVVGKFVEFYGPGLASLSLADRATVANMAPEYGATCGFFPVDDLTLAYLRQTGRSEASISVIESYLRDQGLWNDPAVDPGIKYLENLELDISTIVPCIAGPKRPQDRVVCAEQKASFNEALSAKNGLGVAPDAKDKTGTITYEGQTHSVGHGTVVIAAITSCTNTSNPSVLLAAGLVARKARALGLRVPNFIKTSLSPGSQVVASYLKQSGLLEDLEFQGFTIAGFGCMTCIGNSGELFPTVGEQLKEAGLVMCSVLSGNRNFEARVHPDTAGNYLASPPLVVAYALAGTMNIDIGGEPIGKDSEGKDVFLRDIWPTRQELSDLEAQFVTRDTFSAVYERIKQGNARWTALNPPMAAHFPWEDNSTYIHNPPFFQTMQREPPVRGSIKNAHVLLYLGDSITTDHISPAGNIARTSPAAKYLTEHGVQQADFNSYGARRGNDLVMARGTFANTRLGNKVAGEGPTGPVTVHLPSGEKLPIYDAAQRYIADGQATIVLAGKEYGSGSSRDWAAKGPALLGIHAVIAESYERIHRSNLVGMGIVPLTFVDGQSAASLGLTGKELFSIELDPAAVAPGMLLNVEVNDNGATRSFQAKLRFDTIAEIAYWKHGGVLHYVLRNLIK